MRYYFLDKLEKDGSDSMKLIIFYVRKTICTIFCANCSQRRSILPAANGLNLKVKAKYEKFRVRGVRNRGERCYSGHPREKDLLQEFEKFR